HAAGDLAGSVASAPPTPARTAAEITVVEPRTLGGRPRLTDPQFTGAQEQLRKGLDEVPGATGTGGALSGPPDERDMCIVAAAWAAVSAPERELDSTFLGAGVGGLKLTGITST